MESFENLSFLSFESNGSLEYYSTRIARIKRNRINVERRRWQHRINWYR